MTPTTPRTRDEIEKAVEALPGCGRLDTGGDGPPSVHRTYSMYSLCIACEHLLFDFFLAALAESRKAAIEECAKAVEAKWKEQMRMSEKALYFSIAARLRSLLLPGQPTECGHPRDQQCPKCGMSKLLGAFPDFPLPGQPAENETKGDGE